MHKPLAVAGLALGLMLAPVAVVAQGASPFSVEARAGVGFPTGDFEAEGAEMGVGFGATAIYQATPAVGIYLGWTRYAFPAEDDPEFPELDAEMIDTGFSLGLQLGIPVGAAAQFAPFLRGGALYHKAEGKADSPDFGNFSIESDNTLGLEVAGGVGIPFGQVLTFTPAVWYRSYSPEFEFFGEKSEGDLNYIAAELGLAYRF